MTDRGLAWKKVGTTLLLALIISFQVPPAAKADVYGYRDKNGRLHITTRPPAGKKSKLLIQTRLRPRSFKGNNYLALPALPPDGAGLPHDLVFHLAAAYGLPSSLVRAIIATESGFNPRAVSPKGAKGLMQLMPGVCRQYGVEDPFDPEQNLRAGTAYFKLMLDRFRDLNLALAAYNAGPGAVEKHGGVPPYTETYAFIQSVHHYYRHYSAQSR
ncbi:MAG: transglycosylase SLT domain-containing protein [Thermodesulfobacteriota bacterium]